MSAVITEERLTVAEFLKKYGHCSGVELVRGRVVWAGRRPRPAGGGFQMPEFKHGVVCQRAARAISDFVEANKLGWVAINDTFVTVDEENETVRGADVLYVSYARLPQGPIPEDLKVAPDLVVKVRSPTDRWSQLFGKVGEYLGAGVAVVVVVDPNTETVSVYRDDGRQQILTTADALTLPDVLPDFSAPVASLFA
ncbi:MAG: Uma2 family endonuclease [Planctomycetes bacterium]|nr:Uma2 family endonuclease [Planctomycetota bacterium]